MTGETKPRRVAALAFGLGIGALDVLLCGSANDEDRARALLSCFEPEVITVLGSAASTLVSLCEERAEARGCPVRPPTA